MKILICFKFLTFTEDNGHFKNKKINNSNQNFRAHQHLGYYNYPYFVIIKIWIYYYNHSWSPQLSEMRERYTMTLIPLTYSIILGIFFFIIKNFSKVADIILKWQIFETKQSIKYVVFFCELENSIICHDALITFPWIQTQSMNQKVVRSKLVPWTRLKIH